MRSRNLFKVVPVGLVLVLGTALGAAPASANHTDCTHRFACMWTSNDYPGSPNASFKFSVQLKGSNNRINSIANKGFSSVARFYDYASPTGPYIYLNNVARGGQSRDPNLSNGTGTDWTNWSNRISYATFV